MHDICGNFCVIVDKKNYAHKATADIINDLLKEEY